MKNLVKSFRFSKNIVNNNKSIFFRKSNPSINNIKLRHLPKKKTPKCIQNYKKFLKTTFTNNISKNNLDSEDIFKIEQSQDLIDNQFLKSHYYLQTLSNTSSKTIFDYFGSLKSSYYHLFWLTENDKKYFPPDSSFLKSNFNKLKSKNLNFNDLNTLLYEFCSSQREQTNQFLHEYDNQHMIKEAFYDFNFEIKLMEDLFDVKIKDRHIKHKHEPNKPAIILNDVKESEEIKLHSNMVSSESNPDHFKIKLNLKKSHANTNADISQKEIPENDLYDNGSIFENNDQNENVKNNEIIPEDRTVYSFKDNMTYTQTINQDDYHMVKVGSASDLHMSQFDYADSIITGKKSIFMDVSPYHINKLKISQIMKDLENTPSQYSEKTHTTSLKNHLTFQKPIALF